MIVLKLKTLERDDNKISISGQKKSDTCSQKKTQFLPSSAKAGLPARNYLQQLCEDMGCSPEDLPEEMNDSVGWRERVRDIRADGMTR